MVEGKKENSVVTIDPGFQLGKFEGVATKDVIWV